MRFNAVLQRELTERMRRRNTPVVITVFLLAVIVVFAAIFRGITSMNQAVHCVNGRCFTEGAGVLGFAGAGRLLFQLLAFFAVVLACMIVPALTAAVISGERERQTLVPLQLTLLSPIAIVAGKLTASLAFMLLLLFATLPIIGVTFLIGGVALGEVLLVSLMIVLICLAIGAASVMCSSLIRRSQGATVAAYGLVFVLAIGTFVPMALLPLVQRFESPLRPATTIFLAPNPFAAMASVLTGPTSSPLTSLRDGVLEEARRNPRATAPERALAKVPFWVYSVLALSALTAGSLAVAAWGLRSPAPNP